MFDGITNLTSEEEAGFDKRAAPAIGVSPLSLVMWQMSAGLSFYKALWRMNPALAPYVPK